MKRNVAFFEKRTIAGAVNIYGNFILYELNPLSEDMLAILKDNIRICGYKYKNNNFIFENECITYPHNAGASYVCLTFNEFIRRGYYSRWVNFLMEVNSYEAMDQILNNF